MQATGAIADEDCDVDVDDFSLQSKVRGMARHTSGNNSSTSKTNNIKSSNIFFEDQDADDSDGPA